MITSVLAAGGANRPLHVGETSWWRTVQGAKRQSGETSCYHCKEREGE